MQNLLFLFGKRVGTGRDGGSGFFGGKEGQFLLCGGCIRPVEIVNDVSGTGGKDGSFSDKRVATVG